MAAADVSVEVPVECEGCRAKLRFTVTVGLHFPKDAESVVELLRARLNVVSCPVCGTTWSLQVPLVAVNHETGETLVTPAPEQLLGQLRKAAVERGRFITAVEDYVALYVAVKGWADAYLNRAVAPAIAASEPERTKEGIELLHTPLALLLLYALSEGVLEPRLITQPQMDVDEQRAFLGELLAAAVVDCVDRLFTYAFHHGGPRTVLDRLHEAVPPECLTAAALTQLTDRCLRWTTDLLDDPLAVDRAWRFEYLNAASHAAAGVANPRGRAWADVHLSLFLLSHSPNARIPEEMLLDTAVLRRTLRFADAWNASGRVLSGQRSAIDLITSWFEYIGMAERYQEELHATPIQVDLRRWEADDDATVAQRMLQSAEKVGADKGTLNFPAHTVRVLIRSGRRGAAEQLARTVLHRRAAVGDRDGLGRSLESLVESFNSAMAFDTAAELLAEHAEIVLGADPAPPCDLYFGLLNEMGNTRRYMNQPASALELYDRAAEVIAVCPEAAADNLRTIERNRALVLRELGRFDEALKTLRRVLEEATPDSIEMANIHLSLAVTLGAVNLPQQALTHARAAAAIPMTDTHAAARVAILLALARLRIAAGDAQELPECEEALAAAGTIDRLLGVVASAILNFAVLRAPVARQTIVTAEGIAREQLQTHPGPRDPMLATHATALAEWRWNQGDKDEAAEIVGQLVSAVEELDRLPWQTLWLMARMADGREIQERWLLMQAALRRIDKGVPIDSGAELAAPWLSDKQPFQAFLVAVAQAALHENHAAPADALDVCEFANGRDVRPRRTTDRSTPPEERFAAVAPREGAAVAIAFLESEEAIDLILIPSSGDDCGAVRLSTPLARLRSSQAEFDQNIGSRAILPRNQRAAADAVVAVLEDFGSLLAEIVDAGVHLCLLPSAAVLGLPLHAATVGKRPLLERNTISYAPNLAMLCEILSAGPTKAPGLGAAGVIAVPKDGDRAEFIYKANAFADRLAPLLSGNVPLEIDLRGVVADKAACLKAFERLDYLVVLAHGADSGRGRGRGLCVSDGNVLPRAPLPVDSAPQLRRFLLDAEDLAVLARSPTTVVSLACSSGRLLPGAGGSRIGLERALFANGTRTVIAPLWDVDQESALALLEDFHRRWVAEPTVGPAEHLRAAQLAARDRSRELYHWAPFMLRGSWV